MNAVSEEAEITSEVTRCFKQAVQCLHGNDRLFGINKTSSHTPGSSFTSVSYISPSGTLLHASGWSQLFLGTLIYIFRENRHCKDLKGSGFIKMDKAGYKKVEGLHALLQFLRLLAALFAVLFLLLLILLFFCDGAEAGGGPGALGRRPVVALAVQQPPQGHQGHGLLPEQLLLAVAEVALALEPLELAEGRGGVLVQAPGDGPGLLRLADQDGVTPEHHGHVLDLVPVDPGQDFGPAGVGRAVHLGHRLLRAAVPLRRDGDHAPQVAHVVDRLLFVELHLLPLGLEEAAHPVEGAVRQQVGAGAQQGGEDGVVGQPAPQTLGLTLGLVLHQNKLIPSPGQHGASEMSSPLLLSLSSRIRKLGKSWKAACCVRARERKAKEKLLGEARRRERELMLISDNM
ncbi:unnamed protein product [Menidia menidia]|uniref:(Atlantic silverside) hypothetical protein n=1 Tax=Menidia menidia TaxID=238744 RepID=A0A8S4BUI3_9TELE|nr:unnamed protein product [Menidia menidia]